MAPNFYSYIFTTSNQSKLDMYHVNYHDISSYYSSLSSLVYSLLYCHRNGVSSLRFGALLNIGRILSLGRRSTGTSNVSVMIWQFLRSQKFTLDSRSFGLATGNSITAYAIKLFAKLYFLQHLWLRTMKLFTLGLSKLVLLPKKNHLFTVLRSPHTDKKSREQFIYNYYKGLFCYFWYKNSLSEISGLISNSGLVISR